MPEPSDGDDDDNIVMHEVTGRAEHDSSDCSQGGPADVPEQTCLMAGACFGVTTEASVRKQIIDGGSTCNLENTACIPKHVKITYGGEKPIKSCDIQSQGVKVKGTFGITRLYKTETGKVISHRFKYNLASDQAPREGLISEGRLWDECGGEAK